MVNNTVSVREKLIVNFNEAFCFLRNKSPQHVSNKRDLKKNMLSGLK